MNYYTDYCKYVIVHTIEYNDMRGVGEMPVLWVRGKKKTIPSRKFAMKCLILADSQK